MQLLVPVLQPHLHMRRCNKQHTDAMTHVVTTHSNLLYIITHKPQMCNVLLSEKRMHNLLRKQHDKRYDGALCMQHTSTPVTSQVSTRLTAAMTLTGGC